MAGKTLGEIFNQQFVGGAQSRYEPGDAPEQIVQRTPVIGGKELVCIFNFHADQSEVTGFLVTPKKIDLLGVKPLSDIDHGTVNAALTAKARME